MKSHRIAGLAVAIAVLLVCVFNAAFRLGESGIEEWDEAGYGIVAYEMIASGEYLVTTFGFETDGWYPKPPLGFWLIAASLRAFGINLWALRLCSVLSSIATVGIVIAIGWRCKGPRVGLLAGAILVTTFPFILQHGARNADLDAPFTLLMSAALAAILWPGARLPRAPLLGLLFAAGFLMRTFAIAPHVLAAGAALLLFDRQSLSPKRLLAGAACFLVPIALWAIARYRADGLWFFRQMIVYDFLERSTVTLEASSSSPLYYLNFLWDRFAPWGQVLVIAALALLVRRARAGARSAFKRPENPFVAVAALWTLIPLVLFSMAATRYHWYINPALPSMALLAAATVCSAIDRARLPRVALVGATVLTLAVNEGRILRHILVKEPIPADQRFLMGAPLPAGSTIGGFDTWSQTERFILEAFHASRLRLLSGTSAAEFAGLTHLLVRVDHPLRSLLDRHPDHAEVIASNETYLLYRIAP